jgi:hypothetical protein
MESSDDEDYWLEALEPIRLGKTVKQRQHPFDDLEDDKFRERYRLTKSTVLKLLEEVRIFLKCEIYSKVLQRVIFI